MKFKLQEGGDYVDLDMLPETPNSYPADHPTVLNWIADGNTPEPYVAPVKTWEENRQVEYAKLNQYEMMFDDQRDSTTTWVDAIDAIKAQYPKPV